MIKTYSRFLYFPAVALLILAAFQTRICAIEPVLEKGDRLAIIGDSITEQKQYSKFIETYLLACRPELEVQCFQFGWGGEWANGFAHRMENDLVPWMPDVVTTCYGMNDGSYREYEESIGKAYEDGMRKILERMKKAGATVVVGTPGVVDSFTWRREDPEFDVVYNDNLSHLAAIADRLAKEFGMPHADVFDAMMASMVAAKAKLGEEYHVGGGDGVHPSQNGHLVMAYAFLKGLGMDGNLGSVTIDLNGKAQASGGHKVVGGEGGTAEIESTRYPFCFYGDEKSPNGTRSIVPFVPFNQDLNRFTLTVKNLSAEQADVTFGAETKTFSNEQLTKGINLAAEFLSNPFSDPFRKLQDEVARKQQFETTMIKGFITNYRNLGPMFEGDAEALAAMDTLRNKMVEKDRAAHAKAKAAVVPVRYTITVVAK
jgi:lysophospholipase L1-like esterase